MTAIGQLERPTQNRVVKLFTDRLDYKHLGDWHERDGNSHIEENLLRDYLAEKGVSENLITRAVRELTNTAGDQSKSLYDINKEVYSLLRYGAKVSEGIGFNNQTIDFINWKEPLKNHF